MGKKCAGLSKKQYMQLLSKAYNSNSGNNSIHYQNREYVPGACFKNNISDRFYEVEPSCNQKICVKVRIPLEDGILRPSDEFSEVIICQLDMNSPDNLALAKQANKLSEMAFARGGSGNTSRENPQGSMVTAGLNDFSNKNGSVDYYRFL